MNVHPRRSGRARRIRMRTPFASLPADDAYGDLLFAGPAPAPLAAADPKRVWIETDAAVDERRFLKIAVEEKVSFDPGTGFQAWPTGGATALRLCFSLARPTDFAEGARRLARAWRRAARRRGQ
jgi:hypothetical protein